MSVITIADKKLKNGATIELRNGTKCLIKNGYLVNGEKKLAHVEEYNGRLEYAAGAYIGNDPRFSDGIWEFNFNEDLDVMKVYFNGVIIWKRLVTYDYTDFYDGDFFRIKDKLGYNLKLDNTRYFNFFFHRVEVMDKKPVEMERVDVDIVEVDYNRKVK